jgi:hypothetical protein
MSCKYEKAELPTSPGTEIKVTPEIVVPTIPKATIYHGDFLLPVKKDSVSAFREVNKETIISMRKYPRMMLITR